MPLFLRLCSILLILSGCATNPVTGKSQLSLLSVEEEIAMGNAQYAPTIQQQGGSYYIDPKVNNYVREVGQKLARLSHQPELPFEFTVINSSVPNAWALPGGKIAINTGLLLMLDDEAQLAAVLGHEIVHVTARHSAQSYSKNVLLQASAAIAGAVAGELGAIVSKSVRMGGGMVVAKYGREQELEADYYGTQYLSKAAYNPMAAVELQQKLMALSKGHTQSSLDALFASHPPSAERVTKNQQTAAALPGGKRNKKHFQQQIATLLRDAPAYQHYNNAVEHQQKKQTAKALTELNRAIKLQAKESSFWELKGDLLWQQGNKGNAEKAYDKAIHLNPNFFQHHLARGLIFLDLQQFNSAERDFTAANQQLTTRMGVFYLGETAYQKGLYGSAKKHFQQLANDGDSWGAKARGRITDINKK